MFDRFKEDVRTALAKDPATGSVPEVLLYPGLHAVWAYRLNPALSNGGCNLAARFLSQLVRLVTGVEIHPAAEIGRRVFIDHGAGVVIGETAEIGDEVLLYHGVTLGGDSMRREKRHPTLADGVTVGANATLLGAITDGQDATVGAGAVVVEDVLSGATVVGNPARRFGETSGDSTDVLEATHGVRPADGKDPSAFGVKLESSDATLGVTRSDK